MKTALTTTAVVIGGVALLWAGTAGGRAFTTEGARRLAIAHFPRTVGALRLEDQHGARFALADLRGRRVLVDFIYTSCPTLCVWQGETTRVVSSRLAALGSDVVLLSVSFDPTHDGLERLAEYAHHHDADGTRWRIARPVDATELSAALAVFGITVIPDGAGGFVHNAAVHFVDSAGRLAAVSDYDDPRAALEMLRATR